MSFGQITVKKRIPIYVFFELTHHCNLNCLHCYVVKEKRPELPTDKIKEIIDQLRRQNCLILNFSGGEVFLKKDFFDIAWYAKEKGFAIKVFTNGTLIDEVIAKKIAELKPLRVEITIFSTQQKIHDSITGVDGSLRKSLRALGLLSKEKVPLRIKSTLMKQNVSRYKDIIKLAESLGAKYQFDPNIIPKLNKDKSPQRFGIEKNDLSKILGDPKISTNEDSIFDIARKGMDSLPCSAGHNSCAISCYGDVFPCIILPIRLGNLRRESFSEIWRNSLMLPQLRSIRIRDLPKCSTCKLLTYCNRCPGLAYLKKQDILAKEERACEIAEIKYWLRNNVEYKKITSL